jgi:hypothetical protein
MRGNRLVLVGVVWFALACLFLFFLRGDFIFGFSGLGPRGVAAFTVVMGFICWVILLGWTVPLAYGLFRIFKHQ